MFNTLADGFLTIWEQLESGYWVVVRTYSDHYAKQVTQEANNSPFNISRTYACFPKGFNPNSIK